MYEHTSKPLLSRLHFFRRMFYHWLFASAIIFVSLGITVVNCCRGFALS